MADLTVQNEGSMLLLRYLSVRGRQWMRDHLPEDAQTWHTGVVVEQPIIAEAITDGLEVVR